MAPLEQENCRNEELKEQGSFFIQKKYNFSDSKGVHKAAFFATRNPSDEVTANKISYMLADEGHCDKDGTITVDPSYGGCKIPAHIFAACVQDGTILGNDGRGQLSSLESKHWPDEKQRKEVESSCQSMITVTCNPKFPSRCSVFLEGAKLGGYDIVFFHQIKEKVTTAARNLGGQLVHKFKEDPARYVGVRGKVWNFCKCNEKEKEKCLAMAKGN